MDALSIENLTYTYPGTLIPALREISFAMGHGECVCLTGNSGCGKTTLLLAIRGLLHTGRRSGSVDLRVPPAGDGPATPVGIVFQNAESQILCSTVAEEVAFGPENLCVPVDEIARRVRRALRGVGLDGCEQRNVERFSAGQKQRLTIASVLSMEPSLLLLDEPTSQLDGRGKGELAALLAGLKRQGYTIVITEHDPRPFGAIIDRYLTLEGGRIVAEAPTLSERNLPAASPSRVKRGAEASATVVVEGLSLSYPETGPALTDVNLRVGQGERLHLFGENGAGKSSLLRCLAGLEVPDTGTIHIAGVGTPRPERMPGKVGVLFQNPARQLFAETVHDEVAFTLRRLGQGRREADRVVAETLELCGIAHLADRAPLTLSFGEQHRTALAAVVAPRPGVLLLDEPFAGLDIPQRLALLDILGEMPASYGTTIIIVSHDELPDGSWADRTLLLTGGTLGEAGR